MNWFVRFGRVLSTTKVCRFAQHQVWMYKNRTFLSTGHDAQCFPHVILLSNVLLVYTHSFLAPNS